MVHARTSFHPSHPTHHHGWWTIGGGAQPSYVLVCSSSPHPTPLLSLQVVVRPLDASGVKLQTLLEALPRCEHVQLGGLTIHASEAPPQSMSKAADVSSPCASFRGASAHVSEAGPSMGAPHGGQCLGVPLGHKRLHPTSASLSGTPEELAKAVEGCTSLGCMRLDLSVQLGRAAGPFVGYSGSGRASLRAQFEALAACTAMSKAAAGALELDMRVDCYR